MLHEQTQAKVLGKWDRLGAFPRRIHLCPRRSDGQADSPPRLYIRSGTFGLGLRPGIAIEAESLIW
jgi:hypothetical protein